jgi:hypothetical protein
MSAIETLRNSAQSAPNLSRPAIHSTSSERLSHATHLHSGPSASLMAFCLFPDLNSVRKWQRQPRTKGNGPAVSAPLCEPNCKNVDRERKSSHVNVLVRENCFRPANLRSHPETDEPGEIVRRPNPPRVAHAGGCNGERGKLYAAHSTVRCPKRMARLRTPSSKGQPPACTLYSLKWCEFHQPLQNPPTNRTCESALQSSGPSDSHSDRRAAR